jgi:two-component system, sensor histidine kinase and response regulator
MPELDGYRATAEIRRAEAGKRRTPIVAMTAHSMQGDRERFLAAGMDDYLAKPLRAEELESVLAKRIPGGSAAGPSEAAPGAAAEAALDDEVLDRLARELGRPSGGAWIADLLNRFLADADQRLAGMAAALDRADGSAAQREAHAVKGAASTFGAVRLAQLSSEIEATARDDLTAAHALLPRLEAALGETRAAIEARNGTPSGREGHRHPDAV